eukprot:15471813-Alexandrium_andersonii.AAC.1
MELIGTYWNLLKPVGTFCNLLEPVGTCWNLLEPDGACRNPLALLWTLRCRPSLVDPPLWTLCRGHS